MWRFQLVLSLMTLAGVSLVAQAPALESVLRSELAFARLADEQGIRPAFRTWLLEDARVFTPRMTTAGAHYGPGDGDPGHLAWYPEAMGIAVGGDLAWSLGPWTYARKKGEAGLVHGHFLSLWRRQGSGSWRVEADIGVPHASPERPIEPFVVQETSPLAKPIAAKVPETTAVLRQLEETLATAWMTKGGSALVPSLAREARILRPRAFPSRSPAEALRLLEADPPGIRWEPGRIQVAASGDLAWTCGESGPVGGKATASFLRIWTLEAGAWKVLFDVRLPYPEAPK